LPGIIPQVGDNGVLWLCSILSAPYPFRNKPVFSGEHAKRQSDAETHAFWWV